MMAEKAALLKEHVLQEYTMDDLLSLSTNGNIDLALHHFLIARDLDVNKALRMVIHSIQWRKENAVGSILSQHKLSLESRQAVRRNHVRQ